MTERRHSVVTLAAPIAAVATALYFPWLVIVGSPAQNDAMRATLPWWTFAKREILSGRFPAWDPARLAGTPHAANIQSGLFYVPNWLFLALPIPVHVAIGLTVVGHITLTGVFLSLFARSLRIGNRAAVLAGMAYVVGAFATARFYAGHVAVIESAMWAPLMMLCARELASSGTRRWAGGLAIATWLSIAAGYPALTAYSLLVSSALFVVTLRESRARRKASALAIAAFALAIGAAAPILWPLAELARESTRAGGVGVAGGGNLRWMDLPLLAWPWFYGAEPMGTYWGGDLLFWHELQSAGGAVLVVLAGIGIASRRNDPVIRCLAAVLAISLALALGVALPEVVTHYAPGLLQAFRIPARFLFVSAIVIPVLASVGFQNIFEQPNLISASAVRTFARIAAIVITVQLAIIWYGITRFSQAHDVADLRIASGALCAVFDIAAGVLGMRVLRSMSIRERAGNTSRWVKYAAYGAVLADLGLVAVTSVYSPLHFSVATATAEIGSANIERLQSAKGRVIFAAPYAQYANLGDVFGFRTATAYDPLLLKRTTALLRSGQDVRDPWNAASNNVLIDHVTRAAFDVLGVEYFVQRSATAADVVARTTYLPRMSLVKRVRFAPTADASLAAVTADTFEPDKEIILEESSPIVPLRATAPVPAAEMIRVLESAPGEMKVSVDAPTGGYLLFSESYFPGWQAESDGAKQVVPLVPADHAVMAVLLEPGSHRLTVRFTTPWVAPCLALAALAVAGIAVLLGSRAD